MSSFFEVKYQSLLGRVGTLRTRSGSIETPALFPVINPVKTVIAPEEIVKLGFNGVITNAFIIKKHYGDIAEKLGVHQLLGVTCPVMTDSGAYQLLEYGYVDVSPEEILRFQESIGSDIGVILDIPSKYYCSRSTTLLEVEETLRRARRSLALRERKDMLLVAPLQGGRYYDILEYSGRVLGSLDFDIYAIGGPTQMMQEYNFEELAYMVAVAKSVLPPEKPIHLFGAGHPIMLSLMVALGVDLFDSASYALYARDLRYLTPYGTIRLDDLEYLPCCCPACSSMSVDELKELPRYEKEVFLMRHNLYVIQQELRIIRQAIVEDSLWEIVENRALAHPLLKRALAVFKRIVRLIEKRAPISPYKIHGVFFSSWDSLCKPASVHHKRKMLRNVRVKGKKVLVLFAEPQDKPFTRFSDIKYVVQRLSRLLGHLSSHVYYAVYSKSMGLIPLYLDQVYPLSQREEALEGFEDREFHALRVLESFIMSCKPSTLSLVVVEDPSWSRHFYDRIEALASEVGIPVFFVKRSLADLAYTPSIIELASAIIESLKHKAGMDLSLLDFQAP